MGQKSITKKTFVLIILSLFVSILIFVSLLGENNKAIDLVASFLKCIQSHEYETAAGLLSGRSVLNRASDEKTFEDSAFLLELALLSHFNLLDRESYFLQLKQEAFYFPLMGRERQEISVVLKGRESAIFENFPSADKSAQPVKSLFTVERKNGAWKITGINLDKPPFSEEYRKLSRQLNDNGNFKVTPNGFIMDRVEYDPEKMENTEKYIYRHFLQKASRLISNK